MQPTRYLVLFQDQHGWNCFSVFESLNPQLDGDNALQRAKECAATTKQNYGCETVVVKLSEVADAVLKGVVTNLS